MRRTTSPVVHLLLAGLIVAGAASACGSGGNTSSTSSLNTGQFIEQANAACKRLQDDEGAAVSEKPATDLAGLGRIVPPLSTFLARLRQIRPPQPVESKYNQFVKLWTTEHDRAGAALKDETSAHEYLNAPSPAAQEAETVAKDLGLADCTSEGAPGDSASTTLPGTSPRTGAGGACPSADGSSPRQTTFAAAPPMCIDASHTYKATIKTDKGTIEATLDPKGAPKTVNNFVFLARNHFFDGLTFHRVVPGFVLQGGDPQGTGAGGPGYKFADELPKAGQYKVGSLAMANSGPNTNGSQFFVISGNQGVTLDPKYSLFGQVTSGLDVVARIDALGNPNDQSGKPKEPITITSVTIDES